MPFYSILRVLYVAYPLLPNLLGTADAVQMQGIATFPHASLEISLRWSAAIHNKAI